MSAPEPSAVPHEWKMAVMLAYGHLWHVNNEPASPIALYEPEKAAYAARRQLRDLLTKQERGEAINQVGFLIGRYENEPDDDDAPPVPAAAPAVEPLTPAAGEPKP